MQQYNCYKVNMKYMKKAVQNNNMLWENLTKSYYANM